MTRTDTRGTFLPLTFVISFRTCFGENLCIAVVNGYSRNRLVGSSRSYERAWKSVEEM